MDSFLLINLILLWAIGLLNLLVIIAIARRLNTLMKMFEPSPGLPVGEPVPDFQAQTVSGQPVTLATYQGQAVAFIFIHPNCPPCRQQVPMLEKLYPKAKKNRVELILVSNDGLAETQAMMNEFEVTLPVLIAPTATSNLVSQYNPSGMTPFYCFVNEQGTLLSTDVLGSGEWSRLQQMWEQ